MNDRAVFDDMVSDDYLAHYGKKGMKWGVRHTVERVGTMARSAGQSIGSSVRSGRKMLGDFAGTIRKTRRKVGKSLEKRRTNKQKRLREKTKLMEKRAKQQTEAAELKRRQSEARSAIKKAKSSDSLMSKYRAHQNAVKERQETRAREQESDREYLRARRRREKLDREGTYGRIFRNARDAIIQDQLSSAFRSAAKSAWTSAANNENLSDGARQFAEFMGGVKKRKDNAEEIFAKKGGYESLSDEEIARLRKRRQAIEGMMKRESK